MMSENMYQASPVQHFFLSVLQKQSWSPVQCRLRPALFTFSLKPWATYPLVNKAVTLETDRNLFGIYACTMWKFSPFTTMELPLTHWSGVEEYTLLPFIS